MEREEKKLEKKKRKKRISMKVNYKKERLAEVGLIANLNRLIAKPSY